MLPDTDFHSSSSSSSSLGLSFLHRRRDQIHSMDSSPEPNAAAAAVGSELEAFQRQVADRFHDLASADTAELLSIPWLRNLLDTFLCCHEEFRAILFNNKSCLNKSPIIDRQISDYFERAVKALDVLNAIRDGIEQIRQWKKPLEIVLCALHNQRSIGEGQIRRAKKALIDLTISMLDEKESNTTTQRNRSFGRNNLPKDQRSLGHFRSLSWSVSRNWSAARQLQAIGNNLTPPRTNDIVSTNGLALAVFTMSHVLLFVMWALVAAIPCQDRGLQAHFSLTKQFVWAAPILSLQERILEGSKKRGRRNTCGLLKEIQEMEKCARHLNEFTEMVQFPVTEEKEKEVRSGVEEVAKVYEVLTEGLDPLERQVREVFRRLVRSRTEGLDSTGRD